MYVKAIIKDSKDNVKEITVQNPLNIYPDPYDQTSTTIYRGAVLDLASRFAIKISKLALSRSKIVEIQTDCLELATYLHKLGYGEKVKVLPEVKEHEK